MITEIRVNTKKLLADILTPVSIYLKIRDRFPNSILLESSDYRGIENSYSYICFDPVASIQIDGKKLVKHYPDGTISSANIGQINSVIDEVSSFLLSFKPMGENDMVNGFFGYTAYHAVPFFEKAAMNSPAGPDEKIPELHYSFFRYIISINHFKNELIILENLIGKDKSHFDEIIQILQNGKIPTYPFEALGNEDTDTVPETFIQKVESGKSHCRRGDVFQIVLSRGFSRKYLGDDFNVYRALRNINPSPYLFYFDFGSYRLFGSSPEAQITINKSKVSINPIAGTFKRTGNDLADKNLAEELANDPKENAEHVMLVDLARNDLSRNASKVNVEVFREVQFYSHVIHLVSKVTGLVDNPMQSFQLLADTFPAGTLSGAPKIKAMELIDRIEGKSRGFYGGCIGYIGFNGDLNHAILIRSFLSKNNTLIYRAGSGIVEKSVNENELAEVSNKIGALRAAIEQAQNF
jgi:anthranilate synthase component I